MHTQTHKVTSRCTAGAGEKGRLRFSTDHPIAQQVTSSLFQSKPIRGDDELTFFPYLRPDLLLVSDTVREAACALHMGACVIHTEAGSLGAVDRNILLSWCFGIY